MINSTFAFIQYKQTIHFCCFGNILFKLVFIRLIFSMEEEKALVNGKYVLEKFPGKGGWTYAEIPEVLQNKNNPFGWVQVKGSIDSHSFTQNKLMPMGNGRLFLPVKAEIRKKINKKEGDSVQIILYEDYSEIVVPDEIIACFETESPEIYANFMALSQGDRKAYLDWIYNAKQKETKVNRIATMMNRLQRNLKLSDKEKC